MHTLDKWDRKIINLFCNTELLVLKAAWEKWFYG